VEGGRADMGSFFGKLCDVDLSGVRQENRVRARGQRGLANKKQTAVQIDQERGLARMGGGGMGVRGEGNGWSEKKRGSHWIKSGLSMGISAGPVKLQHESVNRKGKYVSHLLGSYQG